MQVRYLEIVSPDAEKMIEIFEASQGVEFSDPVAMLGNARVANMSDGGRISVRAPMHDAEEPVTRTYFRTDNIKAATEAAVQAGAELAHPVMEIPGQGTFSILFNGKIQFGFWQD